jgi:uncharacterized peroxidase-related enzyme
VSAHAEFLRAASNDIELATRLKDDFRRASLTEQDRRMLEFVEKLTLCPWLLVRSDVTRLRDAGFPDSTTLHIILGSAHFNYLNRMADGIGIRFEYKTTVPDSSARSSQRFAQPFATDSSVPTQASSPTSPTWIAFPESDKPVADPEQPHNLYWLMSYNQEARDLAVEWRRFQLRETRQLGAPLRSQLALYISGLNHCEYSAYWIRKNLERLGESRLLCDQLALGKVPQTLPRRDRLLFAQAMRLTHEPTTTRVEHIQQLRDVDMDDHAILQLTMLCSYFSFENRVALALGVPIENRTS